MKYNVGVRRNQMILLTGEPKSKIILGTPDVYMHLKPAYLKTKTEPIIHVGDVTAIFNIDCIFLSL